MSAAQRLMDPILEGIHKSDSCYFACGRLANVYWGQWTQKLGDSVTVSEPWSSFVFKRNWHLTQQVAIKLICRSTWSDKAALKCACKVVHTSCSPCDTSWKPYSIAVSVRVRIVVPTLPSMHCAIAQFDFQSRFSRSYHAILQEWWPCPFFARKSRGRQAWAGKAIQFSLKFIPLMKAQLPTCVRLLSH